MKEKLNLLKPTEFNDIVAMNALYRPGPMAQIEVYVRRKNKEEQVVYPHPHLEKILKDTYVVTAQYLSCVIRLVQMPIVCLGTHMGICG